MTGKFFYGLFFLFCFHLISCSEGRFYENSEITEAQNVWKSLPIQHQGRVKPFDTFSREILKAVYGKETYKNRSAGEVILSWILVPDFWEQTEFVLIENDKIKKSLDLPLKSKHFRPSELKSSPKLALQLVELRALKQRGERLDSYFQNLEKLETQLILYSAVRTGILIRIEPQKKDTTWLSLPEMTKPAEKQFKKLLLAYTRFISDNVFSSLQNNNSNGIGAKEISRFTPKNTVLKPSQNKKPIDREYFSFDGKSLAKSHDFLKEEPLLQAEQSSILLESLKEEMKAFQNAVFQGKRALGFQPFKIKAEIFYNSGQPFQKAWIFYLLFLLAWLALSIFRRADLLKWLFPIVLAGFVFHSLGMLLRSYIMSRPPVSNMYETVIWVPWVALIAGFIFYLRGYRWPFIASVFLSFFCLFLTNLAPEVLDGRLQPLEAVLRSSFWLTTHVLIITMSYSFFFLAFVLGDMALISYLIRKTQPLSLLNEMFNPIYRSIQWAVIFLAGGTILGGIWADYSWGRFWGWDPKESWALISLLAYLALLHGRLVGWIQAFGLAIGSVMMFFSVIMAWYGVNFVLGVGLHSYGFGSGGLKYVLGFLLLHLILCGLALFKRFRKRSVSGAK